MKEVYRKSEIKFQWLFLIFAFLLIVANVFLFFKFEKIQNKIVDMHLNRFINFLSDVTDNYKNYLLTTLPKENWIIYLKKHLSIQKEIEKAFSLIESRNVKYFYLLGIKGDKFVFLADGSKEDKAKFLETFSPIDKNKFLIPKKHYFFHTEVKGLYLTYINPILKNGKIEALIVADVPLRFLKVVENNLNLLKKYIIYVMAFIVFISIVILFFAYLDYKREKENETLNKELLKLNKELQKKVEEKIKELREKDTLLLHQSKLASLGEMLNMIAHQWRQPLNVMSAAAIQIDVMKQLGQLNEEKCLDFANIVKENTQHLSQIINDFMKLGKHESKKEEFLIKDLLEEIRKLVEVQLKNHNINLIIESDDIKLNTYKKELSHVIMNLISNARDALDERDIPNKEIKIVAKEEGDKIFISVENQGEIPKEIQDRLFEPYFTTKEEGKGTGLGLYMSRKIVQELLKGKIYFESKDGKTRFIIELKKEETI